MTGAPPCDVAASKRLCRRFRSPPKRRPRSASVRGDFAPACRRAGGGSAPRGGLQQLLRFPEVLLQGGQGLRRPLLQPRVVAGLRIGAEEVHRRLVRLELLLGEEAVELRALRALQLPQQRLVLLVQ